MYARRRSCGPSRSKTHLPHAIAVPVPLPQERKISAETLVVLPSERCRERVPCLSARPAAIRSPAATLLLAFLIVAPRPWMWRASALTQVARRAPLVATAPDQGPAETLVGPRVCRALARKGSWCRPAAHPLLCCRYLHAHCRGCQAGHRDVHLHCARLGRSEDVRIHATQLSFSFCADHPDLDDKQLFPLEQTQDVR